MHINNKKTLRCYISAPSVQKLITLRNILNELEVETTDSYEFKFGDLIYSDVKTRIRGTDFSVIVISDLNKNAVYELGICEGLGKSVFLIVEDIAKVPRFLEQYFYLKTNFEDTSLLASSLQNFVQNQKHKSKRSSRRITRSNIKPSNTMNLKEYISKIRELRVTGNWIQIEQILSNIFKSEQILFERNQNTRDTGVDFVAWDDNLSNIVGNPILIEIKCGHLNRDYIKVAEERLQQQLIRSKALAGILLYLDKNNKRFNESYTLQPLIIRDDLEDFISSLFNSSFSEAILSKRNSIVHGVS